MKKLIRFDWAMKRLLRNKANFVVLEGFLSELLGFDIRIRNLLESESNKTDDTDKFNRVDLLVENATNQELIFVEVQNEREYDYFQRILYGASKLVTEYMDEGQPYADIRKVYSVNIVYFDLGHGADYVYHGTTTFTGIHTHDVLTLSATQRELYQKETIAALYPEYYLIKVNQFNDVAKNTLDEWIYFLKHEEIGAGFRAKGLQEAKEKLSVLKLPKKEQQQYKRFLDDLHYEASMAQTYRVDMEDAQKKLRAEGRAEEKKETARKMLTDGLDVTVIARYTGLSAEDIAALTRMETSQA
jgi:predicted transposase/invertase (TIGR01784 family)